MNIKHFHNTPFYLSEFESALESYLPRARETGNNYYNLYLNTETSRYIFRILAVKEILENPKKYGFIFREKDLYSMPQYKIIEIDTTIERLSQFAKQQGTNYKLLKQLNPWLRQESLPDKSRRKYNLKIPNDKSLLIFDDFVISEEKED